jgi:hypothetical protein
MALFNGFPKYAAPIFLAIFCASASLAAANDLNMQSAADARTHPGKEPSVQTSSEFTSESYTEYFKNTRSMITAPEHKDMPAGSMEESLEDSVAITLQKDGDKIIWSLGPTLRTITLNPIEDINNLQVVLKYRF